MSGDGRKALGAAGERLVRAHLEARGLELLDANYRTRSGELDLVARDGRCLVFCEVKTRIAGGCGAGSFGPLSAVGPRKRTQVRRMAREWLAERASSLPLRPPELRFDAIGVTLAPDGRLLELEHLEAAF